MWLLDYLLDRFRWYRHFCGGHWERWYIAYPVCSYCWVQVDRCHLDGCPRPPLARGTPSCEDHPQRWLGFVDW